MAELRSKIGRWLARRDRCSVCGRKSDPPQRIENGELREGGSFHFGGLKICDRHDVARSLGIFYVSARTPSIEGEER